MLISFENCNVSELTNTTIFVGLICLPIIKENKDILNMELALWHSLNVFLLQAV